jgi:hypothetical protein
LDLVRIGRSYTRDEGTAIEYLLNMRINPRRLPTTTWSCGVVVSNEDVTDGAVWRVNMQTPLHEYYSKCMSRYQGTSKLIDKNDVLLYDELCVNVSLLDNTDGKSIPIEEVQIEV